MLACTHFFSPSPGTYAVVRMDPVAMVEELGIDDVEAVAAARAMQPKSYLIYLDFDLELPFPNKPWYRYQVRPVAPSLRAEDLDEGITPDMCVAIFPNTGHPSGRPPVRTEPIFPYKNCYHWVDFDLDIRVRAKPELFDESRAVRLPAMEHVELDCHFGQDMRRSMVLQKRRREELGLPSLPAPQVRRTRLRVPFHEHPNGFLGGYSPSDSTSESDGSSCCSTTPSDGSLPVHDEVDALMAMDIFGGPDQDVAVLPLVDLWLDLADQMKEESIPCPLELIRERDTIVKSVFIS
ncbi:hypothetical protein OH77DRAFT_1412785 [Trametes cingulata]|nr:hypothetical protein OH77DRAFT_1412785 [Trametes cingulata]